MRATPLFFPKSPFDRLRKQDPSFEHLPEDIELPPVGPRRTRTTKALVATRHDGIGERTIRERVEMRSEEYADHLKAANKLFK